MSKLAPSVTILMLLRLYGYHSISNGKKNDVPMRAKSVYLELECNDGSLSLTENKQMTCICCLTNGKKGFLRWIMEYDTATRERLLVHYRLPKRLMSKEYRYKDTNDAGCLSLSNVTIRRDFENSSLLCQSNPTTNLSLKLPPVTMAANSCIDNVRLVTNHVLLGSAVKLICEAKTNTSNKICHQKELLQMYLREEDPFQDYTILKRSFSPDESILKFVFKLQRNFTRKTNGMFVQCVSVTKNYSSNSIVTSLMKKLIVHEFWFQRIEFRKRFLECGRDGYCHFTFQIRSHPEPNKHSFYVLPRKEAREKNVEIKMVNSNQQPPLYEVKIKFKALKFRIPFRVVYKDEVVKMKGPCFFVVENPKRNRTDLQWAIPVIVVLVIILVVFVMLLFAICSGRLSLPKICGRKSNEIPKRENAEESHSPTRSSSSPASNTEPNPSTSTEARGNLLRKQIKPYELEKYK